MNENLKAILQAAAEDEELKGQIIAIVTELNDADEADRSEVVTRAIDLANDKGFELTEEDLVFEPAAEGSVEDEELAVVSGGACLSCDNNALATPGVIMPPNLVF